MLGPIADGNKITFLTASGCWGPMITPTLRGRHEVAVPIMVSNADIGDAVAIRIESVRIKSRAVSSGVDQAVDGAFIGDPYVAKKCPKCGEEWPEFKVEGIGQEAIKCRKCGTPVSPFRMVHDYTMILDDAKKFGIMVNEKVSKEITNATYEYSELPKNSKQIPILIFGKADIIGLASRVRPFMGQLGTVPAVNIPDSHNAGDFGYFLIDAPHKYAITKEQYERDLTDGHLDIDFVRAGAIVIVSVKVKGAGVYTGDAYAM
ncbi:MAG: acetamidase/formamidase family protein [Candidatus Njordarchaeum guaymaensis]